MLQAGKRGTQSRLMLTIGAPVAVAFEAALKHRQCNVEPRQNNQRGIS
jgi:hypothetical protein